MRITQNEHHGTVVIHLRDDAGPIYAVMDEEDIFVLRDERTDEVVGFDIHQFHKRDREPLLRHLCGYSRTDIGAMRDALAGLDHDQR